MQEIKLYPFGENGITYTLFNELIYKNKLRRFLLNTMWEENKYDNNEKIDKILEKEQIISTYLFPSFGRQYGSGEPDVIIITKHYNIFIELETEEIRTKTLKDHLYDQMTRFVEIGTALYCTERRALGKDELFRISKNRYIKGSSYRIRKLFQDMAGRQPLFIIATDGSNSENKKNFFELDKSNLLDKKLFGFINYRKIKDMGLMHETTKTINFNLKD